MVYNLGPWSLTHQSSGWLMRDTITKYPKKYNVPNEKAFTTVKSGCAVMPAHLMFFELVARQFDQFLVRYQTDKPMVPFLCGDLDVIVRGL